MTMKELKKMSTQEIKNFLKEEDKWTEEDIIKASIELGNRDKKEGKYFTTEQIREKIFGKNYMVQ